MEKIIINKLPTPTWRHLKMNYAEVECGLFAAMPPSMRLPEGMAPNIGENVCRLKTGCGEELSKQIDGLPWTKYVFTADKKYTEPLRLDFMFEDKEMAGIRCEINAKRDCELTAIVYYSSLENAAGTGAVQLEVNAAEGAKIHLIQVVNVSEGLDLINDIGTSQADNAQVEITQLYLTGRRLYGGIYADLSGYRAGLKNDIGYLVGNGSELDLNLIARHSGKKTTSEISAKGVLSGNAKKIFRGTIDFINGASGAKGAENEEVLLLDENVVNKTIPLILCAEEDVEGSHGASIGRLDDEAVFYLMSRGLSYESVYSLMAKAKLESVMRNITDGETLDRIRKVIDGGEDHENE